MNRFGQKPGFPGRRAIVAALLIVALLAAVAGCGSSSTEGSGDNGAGSQQGNSSLNSAAKDRAARIAARKARAKARKRAIRARAKARREARKARAAARLAARKARAANRRIRLRARALARSGGDVNCGDFASQARAQLYLLPGDPFGLDGDGDGVACADLPCPCSKAAGGGSGSGGEEAASEPPRSFSGTVVDVADGDTIDVSTPSGSVETIRIIGIDTPEVYGGVECGGPAASAMMKRLATGQRVRVTSDPTQDRRDHYGRLLAYIDKGSQDLGYTMVRRGLASAYPYDGPFQRYPKYARADRRARTHGIGSWSHCDISPG
ncbi:MAG: thermonuclease family protein [Solirubrobacterales bacterium]|nr:thermonuclease family protein [Solirubrobacterales bacterium]